MICRFVRAVVGKPKTIYQININTTIPPKRWYVQSIYSPINKPRERVIDWVEVAALKPIQYTNDHLEEQLAHCKRKYAGRGIEVDIATILFL